MKNNIIIMNFTGTYENETFYKDIPSPLWIDCKSISGTYGYCDSSALSALKDKIKDLSPAGVHFIDSGNFHYVSKLWIDKITIPFNLCLFDNHPDMQPSIFENILSCGDWVKELLDNNKYLSKVIIIGAKDSLFNNIPSEYNSRLVLFGRNALSSRKAWLDLVSKHLTLPLYLSIDKDVLNSSSACTDWDQGNLSLNQLELLLYLATKKDTIIGADICGDSKISDISSVKINDKSNKELLDFLLLLENSKIYINPNL